MSNKNPSNRDHWKELVKSLDLDIDLDEEPLDEGGDSEAPAPSNEEKIPGQVTPPEVPVVPEPPEIPAESVPMSKVDPLFDLGWNSPDEDVMKESPEPDLPVEKPAPKPPKGAPSKKSKNSGFGFGLFSDEPEEPVASDEEPMAPEQEPVLQEEKPAVPEVEPVLELSFPEESQADDKGTEEAGDWMALAAQLGIPIRSETETKQEEASAEEPPIESKSFREVDEEYDPLAAWESPAPAARKSWEKKPKKEPAWKKAASEESREIPEANTSEQDEPIMIGKPKEESDKPKKERRRGRRRGRHRDQDDEVEAVEIIEEEDVLILPDDLDQEPWGLEEESAEEPKSKKRRRRSRRSRKPATVEPEEVEAVEESFDVEIFDEDEDDDEVETSKKIPKSHRGIPSWEEAIGMVVDKNLGTRNGQTGESRGSRPRGGRGRSGRRGGGRSRG